MFFFSPSVLIFQWSFRLHSLWRRILLCFVVGSYILRWIIDERLYFLCFKYILQGEYITGIIIYCKWFIEQTSFECCYIIFGGGGIFCIIIKCVNSNHLPSSHSRFMLQHFNSSDRWQKLHTYELNLLFFSLCFSVEYPIFSIPLVENICIGHVLLI